MTKEEKQRGLELQAYADSLKDMTLKEIAIQHLKKYHLPKFLSGLLVKFSYPLLLAKDYKLDELEKEIAELKAYNEKLLDGDIEKHNKIVELQKENAELKAKIYGGGYEAVIMKKDADIILLEHLLKEQKELHKGVCEQLTHTHKNLRNQLTKAKELIKRLIKATYGEGWNYSLQVKVEAEDFLKELE